MKLYNDICGTDPIKEIINLCHYDSTRDLCNYINKYCMPYFMPRKETRLDL